MEELFTEIMETVTRMSSINQDKSDPVIRSARTSAKLRVAMR